MRISEEFVYYEFEFLWYIFVKFGRKGGSERNIIKRIDDLRVLYKLLRVGGVWGSFEFLNGYGWVDFMVF